MRLLAPLFVLSVASCAPVDVSALNGRVDGSATATDTPFAADDASAMSDRESPSPDVAVVTPDATTPDASAPSGDAPASLDAPASGDAPTSLDAPASVDAPASLDAPTSLDAPASVDAPTSLDAPPATDVAVVPDRGAPPDVLAPVDVTAPVDRPPVTDVPAPVDAGETQPTLPPSAPFGYAPLTLTERRVGDGGSLVDERRTVFTYDAMRRVDSVEAQVPLTPGTWRPLTRSFYRYDSSGRITRYETFVPAGPAWADNERWVYDYDSAGQRTFDHHEVPGLAGAWRENYRYVWQWESGRPTWRRFWQVPSSGGELYYSSYQAYSYEDTGRLRGLGRGDRASSTGSWSDAGGFTYVAWTNGALRAQDFRRNSTTSHVDYLYAASGLLRDAAYSATSHTAYTYDASGRLRFVRSYAPDGAGGAALSTEVDVTHTDAGSSYTFALDPHPYATWLTSYYGRGDVLERYRR